MKVPAFLGCLLATVLMTSSVQAAVFTGVFSGLNETMPNASPATGDVTVTIDEVLQTMLVEISFSGLTGSTTAAHLHCCIAPPDNAPIAVQSPSLVGFPVGVTSGTYSHVFDLTDSSTYNAAFITSAGGTVAQASALLIASMMSGLVYANIHTVEFPAGEIRANLVGEVPLPAAMWLFLAGLAGIAKMRRKTGDAALSPGA